MVCYSTYAVRLLYAHYELEPHPTASATHTSRVRVTAYSGHRYGTLGQFLLVGFSARGGSGHRLVFAPSQAH